MSDPLGHILGFYFADVLIESGDDCHDGPFGLQFSAKKCNYMNVSNATYCQTRPNGEMQRGGARTGGYDMIDGDNNIEELQDEQIKKLEDVAKMLAKIGDNVNEKYKLPEFNPKTSYDSQMEALLQDRLDQSEVQQVALVLRFAKDIVKTASNKESILTETRRFIATRFSGWVRQYES